MRYVIEIMVYLSIGLIIFKNDMVVLFFTVPLNLLNVIYFNRHIGDTGNIKRRSGGTVRTLIYDHVITLGSGEEKDILGNGGPRSIVVSMPIQNVHRNMCILY